MRQPSGGRREVGETSVVGYLTQSPPAVRDDLRIIDYIREISDSRKAKIAAAGGVLEVMDTPEVLLEKVGEDMGDVEGVVARVGADVRGPGAHEKV